MKIRKYKTLISGFVLSQIVLVAAWHSIFAQDVIIKRIPIPKANIINEEKYFNKSSAAIVNVYAAFSSNSEPITEDQYLVYNPVIPFDSAFLYVAFSVNKATKVKIRWKLDGPEKTTIDVGEVGDPNEDEGLLNPSFWYYLTTEISDELGDGLYRASVKVKPSTVKGNTESHSCKFVIYSD